MSNVKRLSEAKVSPNESLVSCLEGLLDDARSGELVGLAWVCQWKGDTVSNGWQLSQMNGRRLVGEIEYMKLEIMDQTL